MKIDCEYVIDIIDSDDYSRDGGLYRLRIADDPRWSMEFDSLQDCYRKIGFFSSKYHIDKPIKVTENYDFKIDRRFE